jgi:uncharacterized integral membrane protein
LLREARGGDVAKLKVIAVLLAVVLMTIIVIQNTEVVETRVLFLTMRLPRALLLALTFAAGAIVGLLIAVSMSRQKPEPE